MQPSSQMLKGILEGAILRIIQQGDIYGYGLHEKLGTLGFGNIPEGTIYPLLMTMEKKGLLVSHMRPSPDGPQRKYYAVTPLGETARQTFMVQWSELKDHVEQLIADRPEK